MKRFIPYLGFTFLLMGYPFLTADAQKSRLTQQSANPLDTLPAIEMENAEIADLIGEIGKRWRVNFLADAYFAEMKFQKVSLRDIPIKETLSALRGLFQPMGRQVYIINGIYVIRDLQAPLKFVSEQDWLRMSGQRWSNDGTVVIRREEGGGLLLPKIRSEQSEAAPSLPAQRLSLQIKTALLSRVVRSFSTHSGWTVGIGNKYDRWRISATMQSVTPGQVLEALCFLMNAAPRLTIEQTPAQIALEAELADSRSDRVKLSDKLIKNSRYAERRSEVLLAGKLCAWTSNFWTSTPIT